MTRINGIHAMGRIGIQHSHIMMKTKTAHIHGLSQPRNNKQTGFTLVEVMVSLLIVVVSISAILTQVMTTIDSTARLRDKTVANWVAMNQLELLYIANTNPQSRAYNTLLTSEINGEEEMAGRTWYWSIKPQEGVTAGSVPLEVTVRLGEGEDASPIVKVIGAIDTFNKPL